MKRPVLTLLGPPLLPQWLSPEGVGHVVRPLAVERRERLGRLGRSLAAAAAIVVEGRKRGGNLALRAAREKGGTLDVKLRNLAYVFLFEPVKRRERPEDVFGVGAPLVPLEERIKDNFWGCMTKLDLFSGK